MAGGAARAVAAAATCPITIVKTRMEMTGASAPYRVRLTPRGYCSSFQRHGSHKTTGGDDQRQRALQGAQHLRHVCLFGCGVHIAPMWTDHDLAQVQASQPEAPLLQTRWGGRQQG